MHIPIIRVLLIATMALVSTMTLAAIPSSPSPQAAPRLAQEPVTIIALDTLAFEPATVTVVPGQQVIVVNEGALQHDLVVDAWGIATDILNGGESATFTVPSDAQPGTSVSFYCSVPGHRPAGMEGRFVVSADAADAAVAEMEVIEEEPVDGEGYEVIEEESVDGEGYEVIEEESVDGEVLEAEVVVGEEQVAAGGTEGAVTVEAVDPFAFDPSSFTAAPGQEIHVVNAGSLQHDFVVDELGLATELLNGGEEETITVPDDAEPGEYTFYCSVPGHRESGMEGTLTVVESPSRVAGSEIDNLEATMAALEQRQSNLSATATAIATEQAAIDERMVALEIQVGALIEATAEAQQEPTPTLEPIVMPTRPDQGLSRDSPVIAEATPTEALVPATSAPPANVEPEGATPQATPVIGATPVATPMAATGQDNSPFAGAEVTRGDDVVRYTWSEESSGLDTISGLRPISLTIGNYDSQVAIFAEYQNVSDAPMLVPDLIFTAFDEGKSIGDERVFSPQAVALPNESVYYWWTAVYGGALLLGDWTSFELRFDPADDFLREYSTEHLRIEIDEGRVYNDGPTDVSGVVIRGVGRDAAGVYMGQCDHEAIDATIPAGLFVRLPDTMANPPVSSRFCNAAAVEFVQRLDTEPITITQWLPVIPKP